MAEKIDSDTSPRCKQRVADTEGKTETTVVLDSSAEFSDQHKLCGTVCRPQLDGEIFDTLVSGSVDNFYKKVKSSPEIDRLVYEGVIEEIADNKLTGEKENKEIEKGNYSGDSVVQKYSQDLFFGAASVANLNQQVTLNEMNFGGPLEGEPKKTSGNMPRNEEIRFLERSEVNHLLKKTDSDGEMGYGVKEHDGSVRCSLHIEVLDETALIESFPGSISGNGNVKEKSKDNYGNKNREKELDGKNGRQSRRRGKGLRKGLESNEMAKSWNHIVEAPKGCEKIGEESKKVYSRKEMEALRFVDIKEQKKKWYEVYCGLGDVVAREYDDLVTSMNQKHIRVDLRLKKKEQLPALFGEMCSEDVDNVIGNLKESETKYMSPLDLGCGCSANIEDGYMAPEEEYSEDSDSDEYYNSIQRPAFLVQGEPDFNSGPPEDGLEYLRRVRWEASQIPKVKVANIDRSKLSKEQTVYMPTVPEIVKCPEQLLPSKQWEDVFLADFVELRQSLSRLEGLDPKSCHGESSEGSDHPTLSMVVGMDSVARASMLRRRISSLENMSPLSRTDCLWLFALCAAIDNPLDADTCAALRSLLRKCASLRADKSELDDGVVMLNILATISGRYFGQAEN